MEAALRIPDFFTRLLARWRGHWQSREAHQALSQLDTRTLRDLGLHRSEIRSVVEEWAGRAERSRRTRFIPYY